MAKKNQNRTNKHKKKEYKSNVTNDVLDLRGPGADGVRRLGLDKNRAMRDIMTEMYENAPPFHIEGTLRHRENIIKAQKCYGDIFHVKIVPTKWFYKDNGDETEFLTLVCKNNTDLILGKPRFQENFTNDEYLVQLNKHPITGLYQLEVVAEVL